MSFVNFWRIETEERWQERLDKGEEEEQLGHSYASKDPTRAVTIPIVWVKPGSAARGLTGHYFVVYFSTRTQANPCTSFAGQKERVLSWSCISSSVADLFHSKKLRRNHHRRFRFLIPGITGQSSCLSSRRLEGFDACWYQHWLFVGNKPLFRFSSSLSFLLVSFCHLYFFTHPL